MSLEQKDFFLIKSAQLIIGLYFRRRRRRRRRGRGSIIFKM